MTEASWPFYGVETNETQFSKWARALASTGIVSGLAITPGTGMQVVVAPGSALVRGVYYESDANVTLPVGAAPAAGLTRKDAVILRLDQNANSITLAVKAGTANNSGGALPAFTQTELLWEAHVGTITVASGAAAVVTANIQELRPSVGLRVYPFGAGQRPTPTEAVAMGINLAGNRLELWVSGVWVNLSDLGLMTGTLPVNQGGTGADTPAQARTNIGASAIGHSHTWAEITGKPATYPPGPHGHALTDANITGILPLNQGGTGASSAKAALQALGIFIQPTAPAHKKGRVWIPGTAPD